jgi:DnaK suppressor protein
MRTEELRSYQQTLLNMRERVTGEAHYVLGSIQDDGKSSNSNLPTHLADVATEGLEADFEVLVTEHGMLAEIETALDSIHKGSYGKCKGCGAAIVKERLQAIPYATLCIRCATLDERRNPARDRPHDAVAWTPPRDTLPKQSNLPQPRWRAPRKTGR